MTPHPMRQRFCGFCMLLAYLNGSTHADATTAAATTRLRHRIAAIVRYTMAAATSRIV